ncbi:hypothetical protein GOP47_0019645 [Adiantum capillus-veneris]|uniref:PROP1-like PPR domain-containing protein n=1 Tax=Adiantum capillus-veneris TaxID=13818 RepID=A0A9D4UBW1_ADICA|nr:hypothetical protein GOP47_0019645 [Adiantum capillus-veneris]
MASMFGASIFCRSPTPACSQQYGSRNSFYPPQRMPFLKLSEAAPNSSWRLCLNLKAQVASVSETVETSVTSETSFTTAEVPARHSHLIPLISDLSEGAHLPSAVEPWLAKLSFYDWEALVLYVGSKDWAIAYRLVSYFKQKAPVLDVSVIWPQSTETMEADANEQGVPDEGESFPGSSAAVKDSDDKAVTLLTLKKSSPVNRLYICLAKAVSRSRKVLEMDQLHKQIKAEGIQLFPSFYNVVLNFYIAENLTEKISDLVLEMEKAGIYPSPFTYEKIAFMYMKKDPLDLTMPTNIMRDLMQKGLPVSESFFKNLLKAYWKSKDIDGVEEVFRAMQATGHTPDQKAIFKVMNCQKLAGNYERILELIEMMANLGLSPNMNVYDELIYAYCKAGLMDKAKECLSLYTTKLGKERPTLVAFNNLIHGYGKQGCHEEAMQAFEDIQSNNYRPDAVSYSSIIAALVNAGQLTKAAQLYRMMGRQGVKTKLHIYVTLIRGYAKADWTREGRKIVNQMRKYHEMTPEAWGPILRLFVDGHWYHRAALILAEMEAGELPLDAESCAALIRSFSILGDKPTPLSKAIEKSNLEICKLLTSLFLAHSDNISSVESTFEENVLPYLKKLEDIEHARAVYNAFMECFWRRGFKTLATRLLSSAREVYAQSTKPEVTGSEWVLDLRGLSVGGAKAALIEWLSRVVEGQGDQIDSMQVDALAESAEDPKKLEAAKMVIVTGNEFQLHVIQDHGVLKRSITDMLVDLNAPFAESPEDPKKLEAAAADVMKWATNDKVKELMDFTTKASL